MKKYLAAAVVAVMVFAFAAFAASLNVTSTNLQVGETAEGALECTDGAHVYAWGYHDGTGEITFVRVALVKDDDTLDTDHDCDGESLMVTPLDADGGYADSTGTGVRGEKALVEGQAEYWVDLTSPVSAEDIHGVRIAIEQGTHVSLYEHNPR